MPTARDPIELRRRIEAAVGNHDLVRIVRGIRRADKLDGFVVGVGETWVLLARLDPNFIELDGYVAVRLADVTKVRLSGGPETFVGRALAARGQWPPRPVDADLDDTAALFRAGADHSALVTLHIEREDPGVCFVGLPVRYSQYSQRKVHLLEVTPEASWAASTSRWRLDEVTRLDFGDHYAATLALVAPPRPQEARDGQGAR